jgi:group I intron endonuclease
MYTIYLITNLVNGKVYVRQTNQRLSARWGAHKADARRGVSFYIGHAIHKYGEENFSIRKIDSAETIQSANFLEESWIFLYNSRNPMVGYNIRPGGNTSSMSKEGKEKLRQHRLGKLLSSETKLVISTQVKKAWEDGRKVQHPYTDSMREKASKRTGPRNPLYNQKLLPEHLVFLCNNGVSFGRLAEFFGVNRSTISRRIKSTGLPYIEHTSKTGSPGGRHVSYQEIDETTLRYLCGLGISMKEVCTRLGRPQNRVLPRMRELGITIKRTKQ